MARKKETRREEREEANEEDFSPEQMGVDEEGQPELSLQPAKKDPTEVEFKHSYVVENVNEKKGKNSEESQRKSRDVSEKQREEDYWYVG